MSNVKYIVRVDRQKIIHTMLWTVENFMDVLGDTSCREYRTKNARIETAVSIDSRFQMKMKFLGRHDDLVEIYYTSPTSVFVKYILSLCLRRYEERSIAIKDYHTVRQDEWQYLATIFKSDIRSHNGRDKLLLADGSFRIKFHLTFANGLIIDPRNTSETQLSNDIENLLRTQMFSDVTMKSVEGAEYKVHKAVLSSRSVVLKAHFQHNTTECITNIIETPFEAEVLGEVLTFLYSDKAPNVHGIAEKLLAAADYYNLNNLKEICEKALHKKLTVDNAIDTLLLADLHSATTLKHLTLEYIKDGHAKHIIETEGWSTFKSVGLIKSMIEHIMADEPDIK